RWHLGFVEHAVDDTFFADLLVVAECFFLDRAEPSRDITLGRLRIDQVARLVLGNHVLVAVEHAHEVGAHLVVAAARGDDLLAAGQLGGLAEDERTANRIKLIESVAYRRVGAAAGSRVRFPALARHPEILKRPFDALPLAGVLQILLGDLRGAHDRIVVAVQLDAEARDRLAGRRDAVDDALGPAFLDAYDHDRRNVRVAAGADQRPE